MKLQKHLLLALAILTSSVFAQGNDARVVATAGGRCTEIFAAQKSAPHLKIVANGREIDLNKRVYAKGVDSKTNPNGHVMIGYEVEYTFQEAGLLLRGYAPAPHVMPLEQWKALSDQARIDWISSRFTETPEQVTAAGLFLIGEHPDLPKELIVDGTGNLEIVSKPFDTYAQWESFVDLVNERFGPGSQQAMVSKPGEAGFGKPGTPKVESAYSEHLGWLVYTNLADMLQKMKQGYKRFEKHPSKLTLMSFNHQFLGPMTKARRDIMQNFLRGNARGEHYSDYDLMWLRKRDSSFKYTGGPAYRPDVVVPKDGSQGRWAWEIRNAHKDASDLKNKVIRDITAHVEGVDPYTVFAEIPAFDSVRLFASLPQPVQQMLQTIFPSKADPRWPYYPQDRQALEVYRNWAWPAQDFGPMIAVLERDPMLRKQLEKKVKTSKWFYLNALNKITESLSKQEITNQVAQAKVMGLMGKFAVDSGLISAFERNAINLGHDQQFNSSLKARRK